MSNSADGRSVTSKLAAILQTFSTGNVHSLSDIARSANLPVSTAHRLTAELAEWGFLERTDDKRYRVGMLVTHLGTRVWHEPNLQEHARRILDDLSSATHATVRLGVLEDLAVSYIEKRPDTHPASTSFETRALPAHATAMGRRCSPSLRRRPSTPSSTTASTNARRSRSSPPRHCGAHSRSPG